METISLTATKREKKAKRLLRDGFVPVVLYGYKIEKTQNLQVDAKKLAKAYKEAGESSVISLDVEGDVTKVLFKATQEDPIKDTLMHADFYAIQMDKEITAEVSLEYIGTSKAVKDEGGTLVRNITEVDVTALPADLPKEIKVDISSLNTFEDVITIKDLNLPPNVKVENVAEDIIATVTPPRSEEELAELEKTVEEDVEEVEGVKKEEPAEGEEGKAAEAEGEAKKGEGENKDVKAKEESKGGK